jgi:hypothetical protein
MYAPSQPRVAYAASGHYPVSSNNPHNLRSKSLFMGLEVLHKRLILAQVLLLKGKGTPLEAISSRL